MQSAHAYIHKKIDTENLNSRRICMQKNELEVYLCVSYVLFNKNQLSGKMLYAQLARIAATNLHNIKCIP